ncbi:uncharacterized protein LAESUDRAFT_720638 [Laetiporus sulphureus 93-53]|uniref:Nucleolar protein 16 n=1 Tax=Laetiporus sulphureus 93-53 TaxID=1314785 RepID=A0A165H932_9APHY|nr:uncharacterized protein LAESUDRAFT_720638 [Laetiporus sulphureus 93-53]KZT11412.1 hypothetical protein LAESUDRAFT_720638 [Laetiporus sulphureus 93-53]
MANPRQRKKLRSGSYKPVSHSRRAKKSLNKQPPIRGPKVLQDAWDKHKTVRQNYEALGLVASLNPTASGGVEKQLAPLTTSRPDESTTPSSGNKTSSIPKGYGRVIRDEDGNIVGVELPEEEPEADPIEKTIDDLPDPSRDQQLAPWVGLNSNTMAGQSSASSTHVVQALEEMLTHNGARKRFSSTGEVAILRRLVAKHGQDAEAMARDRKLNPDQRTAGEIVRAIKKAGGFTTLSQDT